MHGCVMFIDPDPAGRERLAGLFAEDPEISVLICEDGETALKRLAGNPADVVVAEHDMPGMTGVQLLSEVRDRLPGSVRMLLAAFDQVKTASEKSPRGSISAYLKKPWDDDELRNAILDALERRAAEDELDFIVRETGVTDQQVERARRVSKHLQKPVPLSEILIELGFLSHEDYDRVQRLRRSKMTVAEILKLDGILSADDFRSFLQAREREPHRTERELLVDAELATEEQYLRAYAAKHDIRYVEPEVGLVDSRLLAKTSLRYLQKQRVLPLNAVEGRLSVVVCNPEDTEIVAQLERIFELPIVPLISSSESIKRALEDLERQRDGKGSTLNTTVQYREIDKEVVEEEAGEEAVQLVDYLIMRAIQLGASDLHIEPQEKKIRVRVRVDGVLRSLTDLPIDFAPRVTSRLKILAGADIAERRLHQDGRILVKVDARDVDIRYSSYASMFGENSVLRILDRTQGLIPLEKLGFEPPVLAEVRDIALKTSTGLVLVTGPTGSGKTTTLYSFVSYMNQPSLKTITCEDPVEYILQGVIQCNVNEKTGPSFADSLRAILRQDPDVILVGEIRDRITADLGVEAALTGHKVFSTLHTEDAVGSVLRLTDMDIEAFMVASTLTGVVAQRLVRRVCAKCRRRSDPPRNVLRFLGLERSDVSGLDLVEGAGCSHCGGTGYRGRLAIHEVMLPSDDLRDAILRRAPSKELRKQARTLPAFLTLQEDGVFKAAAGWTTLAEVAANTPRDTNARKPRQLREVMASWKER